MTDVEEIRRQLRKEFASKGGRARAAALSKTRLRQIARKAGKTPKKKRKRQK